MIRLRSKSLCSSPARLFSGVVKVGIKYVSWQVCDPIRHKCSPLTYYLLSIYFPPVEFISSAWRESNWGVVLHHPHDFTRHVNMMHTLILSRVYVWLVSSPRLILTVAYQQKWINSSATDVMKWWKWGDENFCVKHSTLLICIICYEKHKFDIFWRCLYSHKVVVRRNNRDFWNHHLK